MLHAIVIGNIGADAEVKMADGHKFITFRVAHNDSYTDAQGNKVERTAWVDCTMNCDAGEPAVLPYLKGGTLVMVQGSFSTRVYSSAQDRCMKAGITVRVQRVELLGGSADPIPRKIYDSDGVQHDVVKFYHINGKKGSYADVRGRSYDVDSKGWVTIHNDAADGTQEH